MRILAWSLLITRTAERRHVERAVSSQKKTYGEVDSRGRAALPGTRLHPPARSATCHRPALRARDWKIEITKGKQPDALGIYTQQDHIAARHHHRRGSPPPGRSWLDAKLCPESADFSDG